MISRLVAALILAVGVFALDVATVSATSQCPFTGGTIVQFSKRLVSQDGWADPNIDYKEVRSITLPAGRYKVKLAASDSYVGRENMSQPRERYYVELRDGSGRIARSNATPDLQDNVRTATWSGTVNNELVVSRNATQIIAWHAAYVDNSSPNSLNPTCVQFVRIPDPVNGQCGSANGQTLTSAPTSGLCASGTVAEKKFRNNTWTWECRGSNGGSTAQCSATKVVAVNGQCGSANGAMFSSAPTTNLCAQGTASSVSGTGPWTWTCNGTNGGSSASCSAQKAYGQPDGPAACPFTGGIVINFGARLRSDASVSDSYQNRSITVPAGRYTVKLASSDGYDGREGVSQPHEQFFIQLRDGSGVIASSNASSDLGDNKRAVTWSGTVNNELVVSRSATIVRAVHAKYRDTSNPNSLYAVCAQLTRLQDPPACGNGKVEQGEQCDDGNTTSGDGCSAQCKNETAQITIVKSASAGGDVQKVYSGKKAKFTITVTNTGKVALEEVVISDPKSPACAMTAAQTKAKYAGGTFNPGKSFTYTCESSAVSTAFTNVASVVAKPVGGSASSVSASDTSQVTVPGGPAIKIVIDDADNYDDRQTVEEGGMATFTVTVTNIGEEDLKDVVITNPLAPQCDRSAAETKALYKTDVFKVGDSFQYTCKSAAVTKSFTDKISVTGIGVGSGKSVTSDDPTYVDVKGKPPVAEPKVEKKKDKKCKGSIGNTVWLDKNANGKQDANEPGIPGVRVWLYTKGLKKLVDKDETNSKGRYKFKELCEGSYVVVVKKEDISALYPTYDPDGKLDHKTKVRLKGDKDHHTKADFGYRGAVAPATGPGTVLAIMLAALATGLVLYYYRRKHTGIA